LDGVVSPDVGVVAGAEVVSPAEEVVAEAAVAPPGDGVVADVATRATAVAVSVRDDVSPRRIGAVSALLARAASGQSQGLRAGEIDHIVILMMENRSFDHMLGYRRFAHPETNGLTGNESNPFSQGAPYSGVCCITRLRSAPNRLVVELTPQMTSASSVNATASRRPAGSWVAIS
jgi:phospholipase C